MGLYCNMPKKSVNCGKLNIGLDLDGVIIDHTQNKMRVAKSFGFKIKPEEIQSEVLKKILPKPIYRKLQKAIYGNLTLKAQLTPDVFKILKQLSKDHQLFIISRRGKGGSTSARAWLKKYKIFEIIQKKNIIFVEKAIDKNLWCKKLKIQIYIDDKVEVLNLLSAVPQKIFYNPQKAKHNKKYLEISSWQEFPGLLNKTKRAC